jgi:hypothetical protein
MKTLILWLIVINIILACNTNNSNNSNLYNKVSSLDGLELNQDIYFDKAWYYKKPEEVKRWINYNLRFESNPARFYCNLETFCNTTSIYYGVESYQVYDTLFLKVPKKIRAQRMKNIVRVIDLYTSSCLFMKNVDIEETQWIQFLFWSYSTDLSKQQIEGIKKSFELICLAKQKSKTKKSKRASDTLQKNMKLSH